MLSKPWKAEKWVFDFISPQRRGIRRSRDRPPLLLLQIIEPYSHFTRSQNFTLGLFPPIKFSRYFISILATQIYTVKFLLWVFCIDRLSYWKYHKQIFWNFSLDSLSLAIFSFRAEYIFFGDDEDPPVLAILNESKDHHDGLFTTASLDHRWKREAMVEGGMAKPWEVWKFIRAAI